MSASTDPSTPRYELVRGGVPSAEQVAALVIALTPVAVEPSDGAKTAVAPWARAALLEGVGGRRSVSAADLSRAAPHGL